MKNISLQNVFSYDKIASIHIQQLFTIFGYNFYGFYII